MEYWAEGPVCLAFHLMPWPGVWMCHVAAKPEGWGRLVEPSQAILSAFWASRDMRRVVAWIPTESRAVQAFARRVGFVPDGQFEGCDMMGWTPCRQV